MISVLMPQYLPAGDYTTSKSNVIADHKDNILELYKDFAGSNIGKVSTKLLVYMVGTGPDDHVEQTSDLAHWRCTIKNQTFVGIHLQEQILRHQVMYPYISFIFVKREKLFQAIWNALSA